MWVDLSGMARAVLSAGAATLQYDAAGNQTFRDMAGTVNDRTVRYSAAGQPHEIVLGTVASPVQRDRFWYCSDGQRYKQQELPGKVTLYVGGVEIVKESRAVASEGVVSVVVSLAPRCWRMVQLVA